MANFCWRCGARLDEVTGLCPNCDADKMRAGQGRGQTAQGTPSQYNRMDAYTEENAYADGLTDKQRRAQEKRMAKEQAKADKIAAKEQSKADKIAAKEQSKADKKVAKAERKRAKRAAMTLGQKVRRFFLMLFLNILLIAILVIGMLTALVYFDIVDIPMIQDVLDHITGETTSESIQTEGSGSAGGSGGAKDSGSLGFAGGSGGGSGNSGGTESYVYTPDEEHFVDDEETGISYVDNMIIIFASEGTSEADIQALVEPYGGEIVGRLTSIDQYQVQVSTSTLEELEDICDSLMESTYVDEAMYDQVVETNVDVVPDDPWGKKYAWSKEETWDESHPDGNNWWLEAVDAMSAWEHNNQLTRVKIGIADNGFDTGHEDLKNKIVFTSQISNKEDHGTHVSGIIGAEANNGKGITGLVWNSELYTYDVLLNAKQEKQEAKSSTGARTTTTRILSGITLLIENGSKVVNVSLGDTASMKGTTWDDTLQEAINQEGHTASVYLFRLLRGDIDFVIVQAAGNGNQSGTSVNAADNGLFCSITRENCMTGNGITADDILDRVIVVGAAMQDGSGGYVQTEWSNAGDRVDICAPGNDIYSTVPGGWSGKYRNMSGTSMATPVVTGVAAMTWAADPNLTGPEVKEIVCSSTKYDVRDNTSSRHPLTNSYRLVNANLAVEEALRRKNGEVNDRDVVLVLDASGSMDGTPMEETKKAAERFLTTAMAESCGVGVVSYSNSVDDVCEITRDKNALRDMIRDIRSGGGTNIEAGLSRAREMLNASNGKKKIIVLMSDGLPNDGKVDEELVAYADTIKNDDIMIYTLGFFQNAGSDKANGQKWLNAIASEGCHYEVDNANDLVFFFDDIADQISGQRYIYIRIACPVDVKVTYNGETLSSKENRLSTRTDFGTLTFEEEEEEESSGNGGAFSGLGYTGSRGSDNGPASSLYGNAEETVDNRIKILRLKEGAEYHVEIEGNGTGSMDYTIGFMDADGGYSDMRTFKNIEVNRKTKVETDAKISGSTVLDIDSDGDGKVDQRLKAGENGRGKEVLIINWFLVGAAGTGIVVLFIVILVIRHKIRKRRRQQYNPAA